MGISEAAAAGIAADVAAASCLENAVREESSKIRKSVQDRFQISSIDAEPPYEHVMPVPVSLLANLQGTTPFQKLKHYVLVTPQTIGHPFVQHTQLTAPGEWSHEVKIGEAGAGVGEVFHIQLIATRAELPPGQLTAPMPDDALASNSVLLHSPDETL